MVKEKVYFNHRRLFYYKQGNRVINVFIVTPDLGKIFSHAIHFKSIREAKLFFTEM